MTDAEVQFIAYMAYEVHRAYAQAKGQYTLPAWNKASDVVWHSAMGGVRMSIHNRFAVASDYKPEWMVDDSIAPYLFRGTVRALLDAAEGRFDPVVPLEGNTNG